MEFDIETIIENVMRMKGGLLMRRKAMDYLVEWKEEINRKPLIIRGARQVGKTWLMKEFGKLYYEQCVYIMMDENERMQDVFRDAFDIQRIIMALQIECGFQRLSADNKF